MIVDDQEVIREAFGMLLSSDPTVDLVGALADGESAVRMVPVLEPDVVIMDVKMPGVNGITAAKRIREDHPEAQMTLTNPSGTNGHSSSSKVITSCLVSTIPPMIWAASSGLMSGWALFTSWAITK